MKEDIFVTKIHELAESILKPPFYIKRGASLLYEITINNHLEITVDPQKPKRGKSAFQTDLCVFEIKNNDIHIPRIVFEFKKGVSTHDVITYNVKAGKHKKIYPYLRYGMVSSAEEYVPGKFFTHNEKLDFFIASKSYSDEKIQLIFEKIIKKEIKESKKLENLYFDKIKIKNFSTVTKTE